VCKKRVYKLYFIRPAVRISLTAITRVRLQIQLIQKWYSSSRSSARRRRRRGARVHCGVKNGSRTPARAIATRPLRYMHAYIESINDINFFFFLDVFVVSYYNPPRAEFAIIALTGGNNVYTIEVLRKRDDNVFARFATSPLRVRAKPAAPKIWLRSETARFGVLAALGSARLFFFYLRVFLSAIQRPVKI